MKYKLGDKVADKLRESEEGMIVEIKNSGTGRLYNVKTWNQTRGEYYYTWCSDFEIKLYKKGFTIGFNK